MERKSQTIRFGTTRRGLDRAERLCRLLGQLDRVRTIYAGRGVVHVYWTPRPLGVTLRGLVRIAQVREQRDLFAAL